jgi:hypothetical protein
VAGGRRPRGPRRTHSVDGAVADLAAALDAGEGVVGAARELADNVAGAAAASGDERVAPAGFLVHCFWGLACGCEARGMCGRKERVVRDMIAEWVATRHPSADRPSPPPPSSKRTASDGAPRSASAQQVRVLGARRASPPHARRHPVPISAACRAGMGAHGGHWRYRSELCDWPPRRSHPGPPHNRSNGYASSAQLQALCLASAYPPLPSPPPLCVTG